MAEISARPILQPQSWRRRHFRLPARDAVANGGQLSGTLLNVARSGMALETSSPVRIGEEYRLKVRLDDAEFSATGRVRWCVLRRTQRQGNGEVLPVFHAGLSLEQGKLSDVERVLDKLRHRLLKPPAY